MVAIGARWSCICAGWTGMSAIWVRSLPIGMILCGEKNHEQIELLQLDRGEIRVAEYLVELPPREMLEAKLHEAIRLARGKVETDREN